MKLSISRDNSDLTPDQPSIDENIAEANKILDEYEKNLEGQYIVDNGYWEYMLWKYKQLGRPESMKQKLFEMAASWAIKILFGGENKMADNKKLIDGAEVAFETLEIVMGKTNLDDIVYKELAERVKKEIPGDFAEPVIGEILIGVGKELKKPE